MFLRKAFGVLVFHLLLTPQSMGQNADYELQLLYPDQNVSSRPIIEFRYRNPSAGANGASPGHAFVLIGREQDNGQRVYYSAGGFYPEKGGKLTSIQNTLNGPGEVTYKIDDLKYDGEYFAYLTPEQERIANHVIKNWDNKDFALVGRNCANLVKDVANAVGLSSGDDTTLETPWGVLEKISSSNTRETPLERAIEQRTADAAFRRNVNSRILRIEEQIRKDQRETEAINQMRQQMHEAQPWPTAPVSSQPTTAPKQPQPEPKPTPKPTPKPRPPPPIPPLPIPIPNPG